MDQMLNIKHTPFKSVSLQYLLDSVKYKTVKPYRITDIELESEDGIEATNIEVEEHDVVLTDLRYSKTTPRIDIHGFEYVNLQANDMLGSSDEADLAYCEKVTALVKQQFDADRVICYDLRFRKHDPEIVQREICTDRTIPDSPVKVAHIGENPHFMIESGLTLSIDHTKEQGRSRVARHLTSQEKNTYLNDAWRIRIVNVWKPLNDVIKDMPLAICDSRTVKKADLIPVDQIGPGFVAEIYYLKPDVSQQWYWLSDQKSCEALVFLSWDSHSRDDSVNCCPHASFVDKTAPIDAPLRRSVEVRLIVFTRLHGQ